MTNLSLRLPKPVSVKKKDEEWIDSYASSGQVLLMLIINKVSKKTITLNTVKYKTSRNKRHQKQTCLSLVIKTDCKTSTHLLILPLSCS